jgi:hypothetical protein
MGILACLLAAEAVAAPATPLSAQLSSLYAQPLRLESGRIGERRAPELMPTLKVKLRQEPTTFSGRKINLINRMDGLKFIFNNDLCGNRISNGHGGAK